MDFDRIQLEIQLVAVRSRGPGGQNVNKVSSAAQLFWPVFQSGGLSDEEKVRIGVKLANLINSEGELVLRSDEFRDLERNKSRVIEKLEQMLTRALHRPKVRKATRPTRASRLRRHESKKRGSEKKRMRKRVSWD